MRHSYIYSALHLSTLTFSTAAPPPAWNKAQRKPCLPFDLNKSAAEETRPESFSSSDQQIASSSAMHMLIDPGRYTPEELAANILVFPGPQGPNPSAGVQSASSHGREHRGYPLGQQSSSSRFPSTSTGQPKASDSTAGSTSQRIYYKKVGTSYRYEPYTINQTFSLRNSVSDVYVLPTEKYPTRGALGKLKDKELAVCTGLSRNKKEGTRFNVYDWNFLREYPEREKADDHQHQYLRYLNQCKGESDVDSFFFIQRDRANEFLNEFFSRTNQREFNLSLGIHKEPRMRILFETLLRLSDRKIGLDGDPFFENEIIGNVAHKLIENLENTRNPSLRPSIENIVRFVRDVTKVTQLLIVAHMSLFKEHEQELLKVEEVEENLRFLHKLWLQIDEGNPEILKNVWAMKAHRLFKFQAQKDYVRDSFTQNEKKYRFCWNIVNYWREKNGRSLRGSYSPETFTRKLKELVSKIIFFSNYED